jgi:hypothetical protein
MKAHEMATRINPDYAEAYMSLAMLCDPLTTNPTQKAPENFPQPMHALLIHH